jgi:multidrug resistance protein, MATE family
MIASLRLELAHIARLSGPVALSQLGMMTMGAVETFVVAHQGPEELAASALGNVWEWTWLCLGVGLVMGIDPLISQAHGRGDGRSIALALQRGIVLGLLASIPICMALVFTEGGLLLLGQDPHVAELAARYNLYKLPTVPCFLVYSALRSYLQGRTMMLPVTVVMWSGNVVHALLAWLLVFGGLGIPALGLVGAALAESITFVLLVGALSVIIVTFGLHRGAWRRWTLEAFVWRRLVQTARLGVPIGMQIAFEAWAFSLATFMAGWLGSEAVGSHQVVLNLAALAFMIPLGVSQGAATRVGNLIGAGNREGLRVAVSAAVILGAAVMVPSALAFTLLAHELPALYSSDPIVIDAASQILPIAAAFQLCDGAQVVAAGVLRGMGRPDAGAVLSLIGYYALALPLAFVAAFIWGFGLVGIWSALALGLTLVTLALVILVRRASRQPALALEPDFERRRSSLPPPSRATLGAAKSTWGL